MLIGLFLFICASLFSYDSPLDSASDDDDKSLDKRLLFVSLGTNCEPALQLRDAGHRKAAFPFDWLVTASGERLAELLDRDFDDFLGDASTIVYSLNHCPTLANHHYQIEFRHDWPKDLWEKPFKYPQEFGYLKAKYQRRIDRFRNLKNYQGTVCFFRTAYDYSVYGNTYIWDDRFASIQDQEAQALKNALKRYFPSLKFVLVVINYGAEFLYMHSGVEQVLKFQIRKADKHEDYKTIFNFLNYGL